MFGWLKREKPKPVRCVNMEGTIIARSDDFVPNQPEKVEPEGEDEVDYRLAADAEFQEE